MNHFLPRLASALTCCAALAACSDPSSGSEAGSGGSTPGGSGHAVVEGTIAGSAVSTTDVTALVGPFTTSAGSYNQVLVLISSLSTVCGVIEGNHNPARKEVLAVSVTGVSEVSAGTYSYLSSYAQGAAEVEYSAEDDQCQEVRSDRAVDGTVTFSSLSAAFVEGSFDVTLEGGGALQGTFTAPVCGVSLSAWRDAPATACGG